MTDETTIIATDLPKLRAELIEYASNEIYSDSFQQVCRDAIVAIDQARDEDEATHAPLQSALEKFVAPGAGARLDRQYESRADSATDESDSHRHRPLSIRHQEREKPPQRQEGGAHLMGSRSREGWASAARGMD